MQSNGRTPFEELTMNKFQSPLLNFGEAVFVEPKEANWVHRGIWAFGWDGRRGQMNILLAREQE